MARLSKDAIIDAAARVADVGGLTAVSMRNVAKELGVEAMSLYHHVQSKDALIDALADWAMAKILLPVPGSPWREAMADRAHSAREVLREHTWALGLLESRPIPGPALLRHNDRVTGCLLEAGFSSPATTHAVSVLDAYVYGFVLTENTLPFTSGAGAEAQFASEVAPSEEEYPYLVRSLAELFAAGDFSFTDEFDVGLELILDGIAQRFAPTQV